MSPRIAISTVLLAALLAGILSPIGHCALMCERRSQAEVHHHCSTDSDPMPGMAHDHSAMNHPPVEAMSAMLMSQSCRTNCVTAERLNVWRKVVPEVTVVGTSAGVLSKTIEFLAPNCIAVWGLDSGPPARRRVRAASFSILRI